MALSPDEKVLAETAYARARGRGPGALLGVFFGAVIGFVSPHAKDLADPHTSHETKVLLGVIFGTLIGAGWIAAYFISRQRKRDLELVRFFEKRFPEDCSWKQEEKILAEAEDLRLKAKVDWLIHKGA